VRKYYSMSTDRVTTAAQRVRDSVKEAIGTLTGDSATEAQGKADKAEAKSKKPGSRTKRKISHPSKC
jgi:uncharacterized protein YjbJ (UPF0337 family)